jgi:PAS domain S-box-containing protein
MDGIGAKFRQLETAMRCLSAIVENSSEAVAVIGLDGGLLYANPQWARIHGFQTSLEFTHRHISAFTEQKESETGSFIRQAVSSGRLTRFVAHRRADGTKFPAELTLVVLRNESGKAIGLVAFVCPTKGSKDAPGSPGQSRQDEDETNNRRTGGDGLGHPLRDLSGELMAVRQQLSEQYNARAGTEQQLKKCQQEIEFLVGELSQAKGTLKQEQKKYAEQMQNYRHQMSGLKDENNRLKEEIAERKHQEVEYLDDISDQKGAVPPVRGLDTQELKQLSEMAKKYIRT